MFVLREASIDDLMRGVLAELLSDGHKTSPTKGSASEILAAGLTLTNPRARLSRSEGRSTAISALGELVWYLSGSDLADPISYYIPFYSKISVEDRIEGAYGPRLFGAANQLQAVIELLRSKNDTRRAVVQIYDKSDMGNLKDVPCTCTLQFFARGDSLHLVANMRSNDAYMGLPHDIFCFTMIQELVARSVGLELGEYVHFVGSLHLYDTRINDAKAFLDEGWYLEKSMPPMPEGDPWAEVGVLIENERRIRESDEPPTLGDIASPYWRDLTCLFAGYRNWKSRIPIADVLENISDDYFQLYLSDRQMREGDR